MAVPFKQFSIKSLMLAIAALAVLLAMPRQRSLRQQFALAKMRAEIGGGVGLDSQSLLSRLFFGNRIGDRLDDLIFTGVSLSEPDAARLALFPMLSHVRLHNCPAPEQTISVLHLARVNLTSLTVTDARLSDLRTIAWFSGLRILNLERTNVSDVALRPIGDLLYLGTLDLERTSIRGPGLAALCNLPRLEDLDLRSCPIDDAAVEHLKRFPALRYLRLQHTNVSREAIEQLQQTLPNCDIESDYGDVQRKASKTEGAIKGVRRHY